MSNPIDEMSHSMMSVSNDLVVEFRVAMPHDNMDISFLMVHAQQVEESRLKRKSREFKRARPHDGRTSKGKL